MPEVRHITDKEIQTVWDDKPFFLLDGRSREIEDDTVYYLDPSTVVVGDRTGPCRIFMFSAARQRHDGTVDQQIAYMHATPASVSLDDPRSPRTIEEKRTLFHRHKQEMERLGFRTTRILTFTQANGVLGEIFQNAYEVLPNTCGWQPLIVNE